MLYIKYKLLKCVCEEKKKELSFLQHIAQSYTLYICYCDFLEKAMAPHSSTFA